MGEGEAWRGGFGCAGSGEIMSEPNPIYDADTADALEMLGKGYEHPAIEIEQERTVIQRRAGKLESVDRPAFVKISTAFKQELATISGDALKVWLFISLSINRRTNKANPGLRTIAEQVNLAVNTVQKCLQELESLELLTVDRQSRKYNIYETPEYVSANRAEPTVSNGDTVAETVSNFDTTVSNSDETVSPSVILNQSNQNNQRAVEIAKTSFEAAIYAGQPIGQEQFDREHYKDVAPKMFEAALGFSKALPWWSTKEWEDFAEWVVTEYIKNSRSFGEYNIWRNSKYTKGGITNTRLRGFPAEFYDSWDMFLMATKKNQEVEYTRLL